MLENKFHSLELKHIPRRLNEATDALAKTAFSRKPTRVGTFVTDLHTGFVRPRQSGGMSDDASPNRPPVEDNAETDPVTPKLGVSTAPRIVANPDPGGADLGS